jgi:hypothetical protein
MKKLIRSAFRACGFDLVPYRPRPEPTRLPSDITERDRLIIDRISDYTMTSLERKIALIQATRYLTRHNVEGCIIECGVWRGGSSMAAALTLIQEGDTSRDVYLFDTFEGMPPPKDVDRTVDGTLAQTHLDRDPDKAGWVWAVAGIDDVRRNMGSTGYPQDRVKYVKGPVEATIPSNAPAEPIALLRLDTDWYESTKHELTHLFPRLSEGGVLIIDDYGHWEGARKAVDEYFTALGRPYFLHRVDYTGRLLVKSWRG